MTWTYETVSGSFGLYIGDQMAHIRDFSFVEYVPNQGGGRYYELRGLDDYYGRSSVLDEARIARKG